MLFGKLFIPVSEFMKQKLDGENVGTPRDSLTFKLPPPLVVTPETTFAQALGMFCTFGVHRLFVQDQSARLLGVVTPLDIISCFKSKH